jgi:hypothetical protein
MVVRFGTPAGIACIIHRLANSGLTGDHESSRVVATSLRSTILYLYEYEYEYATRYRYWYRYSS